MIKYIKSFMDFLIVIKHWLIIDPIDKIKSKHTILCPKCYKEWHQLRKYKPGQNTLCKDCRNESAAIEEITGYYGDYDKDIEFENFIAECSDYVDTLRKNAFEEFMNKVGIKDTFAYNYDCGKNKVTIFTCRPGVWIGFRGDNVKILKEILSKEIHEGCYVEFVEIKGKFLSIDGSNSSEDSYERK